jgi:hypothetical protein
MTARAGQHRRLPTVVAALAVALLLGGTSVAAGAAGLLGAAGAAAGATAAPGRADSWLQRPGEAGDAALLEPKAEPVPAPAPEPAPPVAPPEPTDEQVLIALIGDLQRYGGLSVDEVRRELAAVSQALVRQRSDANRVRQALLHSLIRTAQDDQRALQVFDSVARSNPGTPAIKQLSAVLQAQVAERVRAVREEQQKADAAMQKLEALRAMERSLLRDRVRSGGGGGGGGGSGN